jgi:hypothetical protein
MAERSGDGPRIVPPEHRVEYATYAEILRRIVPPWPKGEGESTTSFSIELPNNIQSVIDSPWEPYEGDSSSWATQSIRVSVIAVALMKAAHDLDVSHEEALTALKWLAEAINETVERERQDQTFLP